MDRRASLVDSFMGRVAARDAGEDEFLQAVEEVAHDVLTVEKAHAPWAKAKVLERLTVPDRIVEFRVPWTDDEGETQVNRGWRVQNNNAIGPYKGGLRFHPTVSRSVLKFLAFEQTFKNALTGLPLGGAKGGADFDPKGRSTEEIQRFCQSFMTELAHHIGPDQDVPAGDINVGPEEIGYLFGAYLRQKGQWHGALTGKGTAFGGSALRIEATGFGLVYLVMHMLHAAGEDISGARVAISGMGNVARHAAEKACEVGATVVTLSDTSGTLRAEDGIGAEALEWIGSRKDNGEDIAEPPARFGMTFEEDAAPWSVPCDVALPCATQNEIGAASARALIDNGLRVLAEGANMPLTADAQQLVRDAGLLYAPGKAANAGGVAVSGLEMSQNSHGRYLSRETVDQALREIMGQLHADLLAEESDRDRPNYARAANVAAYRKLARAVCALGV